jgi:pyrimidine-nucleoside phosphorylase
VGDKTTLVVAPLVSAAGVPVGKMTGRGLGFTGGTVDKLESIPGLHVDLSVDEFLEQLRDVGIVVAGQTADLAPADGKLYALRDVTGTVDSIPLIASSIMSKKIAAGANGIVLDVKVGLGAFMHTEEEAQELARAMVTIGERMGRRVVAIISDMNQPLGCAVGNALEVREAIATLQGQGPPDFVELCLTVASQMVRLAGRCQTVEECRALLMETLQSGTALERFRDLVRAQGGVPSVIERPEIMPQAQIVKEVRAFRPGYVETIDAMEVGLTVALLGAGRVRKGDPIDPAVGLVLAVKVGDCVEKGQLLYTIHANDEERLAQAERRLQDAFFFSAEPVTPPPLIHRIIGSER